MTFYADNPSLNEERKQLVEDIDRFFSIAIEQLNMVDVSLSNQAKMSMESPSTALGQAIYKFRHEEFEKKHLSNKKD
jgi:hypothetical protein